MAADGVPHISRAKFSETITTPDGTGRSEESLQFAQGKLREACFLFPVPYALFPSVLWFAINRR
jgi:hypothetical protein